MVCRFFLIYVTRVAGSRKTGGHSLFYVISGIYFFIGYR